MRSAHRSLLWVTLRGGSTGTSTKPYFVHVLVHRQIVKSGGAELALELEEKGYSWVEQAAA